MLDELALDLVDRFGAYIRRQQALKSPISRTNRLVHKAMESNADWLAMQDIPQPIVRTHRQATDRTSPKLSPATPARISRKNSASFLPSSSPSNTVRIGQPSSVADDIFMDDADVISPSVLGDTSMATSMASAWKGVSSIPR